MKFLKQSFYVRYVIAKLSKSVQINKLASSDSFLQRILRKLKRPGTRFEVTFFIEFYDKKSYLVMLQKLAKFHYQAE